MLQQRELKCPSVLRDFTWVGLNGVGRGHTEAAKSVTSFNCSLFSMAAHCLSHGLALVSGGPVQGLPVYQEASPEDDGTLGHNGEGVLTVWLWAAEKDTSYFLDP